MSAAQKGRFITLEGGEGAGKSTQIRLLQDALENAGRTVICTREPGGSPGGEAIRELLVKGDADWEPLTEALLNYAARHEHLEKVILPTLADGTWVLCDRFADSTMAYQGYGYGMNREVIRRLHRLVVDEVTPDLTLIFDMPVDEGLKRAVARGDGEDRYERMGKDFHERLREGFLEIAKKDPARCAVIDATGDIGAVAMAVHDAVMSKLRIDL
ncbi:dTMP kinase [Magnetovibrio sp. PR-2]|uniref:dTMP kinase n=1 Tax=Magnetovibrio sp. PR-2 TaxID=3120356 RepID=UPI002FCE1CCA